jgi:hypothetical protein
MLCCAIASSARRLGSIPQAGGSPVISITRQRLDQAVLKLEPFVVLLHADALVAPVRAHIIDVAEGAVNPVRRNPGVAQVQAVGRAGAHHRNNDDAGKHVLRQRLHGSHHVGAQW